MEVKVTLAILLADFLIFKERIPTDLTEIKADFFLYIAGGFKVKFG